MELSLVVAVPVERVAGVDELRESVALKLVRHDLPAKSGAQTTAKTPRQHAIELKRNQAPGHIYSARKVPALALVLVADRLIALMSDSHAVRMIDSRKNTAQGRMVARGIWPR